jgi:hypothetical protein
LRIWIQNKGGMESSEAIEVVAKDSFGSAIFSPLEHRITIRLPT